MTRALQILSVLVLIFSTHSALSASQATGPNLYLSAGPNFITSAVRVGWNRWELGLLSRNFVGFNKTFPISGRAFYAGFGLGTNTDPFQKSLGFQAAVGFNYDLLWNLGFRGEMLAVANLNGSGTSTGLLGVSYGF